MIYLVKQEAMDNDCYDSHMAVVGVFTKEEDARRVFSECPDVEPWEIGVRQLLSLQDQGGLVKEAVLIEERFICPPEE